uniref:F-box protein 33 n=1 Tax=Salarias fasciatus TaxID=181472 RepID=A0A672FVZ1_SALFA
MALCAGVGAMALPSELIVHIFSFLSDRDKLRPRLCVLAQTAIGGGSTSDETPKLEFLMRKFGSFVRELQLKSHRWRAPRRPEQRPVVRQDGSASRPDSDPQLSERWRTPWPTYLDQVLCVFSSIKNNRNLQKLSLYGDTFILQQEGLLDSSNLHQIHQGDKKINEIQQLFMELLSNSRQLKWLSCSFMLGLVTPCSLACLSNPSAESLQHLSLLDHQPSHLTIGAGSPLQPALSGSDFSDLTSELCGLLASPRRTPLHRLSLLFCPPLHKSSFPNALQVRVSANLRVYIMALEVDSSELLRFLKPSLPLERLHLDSYSTLVTDATLELISQQYNKTLTHFLLLRDGHDFPDLNVNRNEDPLVLLAWRCTQLAVLVIHGYTVWSHNLVAISRLRGSSLRVLTVSEESIDFDPDQSVYEVSLGLGRVWHPCLDSSLVLSEPTQHFHRELHAFSMGM